MTSGAMVPGLVSGSLRRLFVQDDSHLNVIHINARSIPRHIHEISDILSNSKTDFCTVSESFLNNNTVPSGYEVDGFTLLRNDRQTFGGGTAIYCSKAFNSKIILKSDPGSLVEFIFVEIRLSCTKVLLGAVYNPPPSYNKISILEDALSSITPYYENIIVCGDLNINLLRPSQERHRLTSILSSFSLSCLDFGATCHSPIAHESSLIDYMIVNDTDKISDHGQLPVPLISEHDLLFLRFQVGPKTHVPSEIVFRNFNRVDQDSLLRGAAELDWNRIYSTLDIDDKLKILYANIKDLSDKFVPQQTIHSRLNNNVWYNKSIRDLEVETNRAYNLWRRTKSPSDRQTFCKLRNRVTSMKRCYQFHCFSKRLSKAKANPKKFHSQLQSLFQERDSTIPPQFTKCLNTLNKHFTSVEQRVILCHYHKMIVRRGSGLKFEACLELNCYGLLIK